MQPTTIIAQIIYLVNILSRPINLISHTVLRPYLPLAIYLQISSCYNSFMQEIYFYLDDSGVLHPNSHEQFFVYAGYVFLSHKEKDRALCDYRRATRQVNPTSDIELKAHGAKGKTKRYLNSILQNYESLGCVVDKHRVYTNIIKDKKSIHRYKDYCLKRIAKAKLLEMISRKIIDPNLPTTLRFFIDNQPTSTDGIYNLRESIREEFAAGIQNFDYGVFYEPIFHNDLIVTTSFCDSRTQPLIQASDILANSIFIQRNYNPRIKHNHQHHTEILLP